MSNVDIGPKKTMFILVIVVGCFAVLWPKIFYPMLVGNTQNHITPNYLDKTAGCCDVIWENDVNAIKIMTDLCGSILRKQSEGDINIQLAFETRRLTKDVIEKCRNEVLLKCNVDIASFLSENVKLGKTYRQILFELRSTNSSLCLKYNFGVIPEELGIPHRVLIDSQPSVRQERPSHFRPEMLHPALREKGRAIPHYTPSPVSNPPPRIVEGRPGPIPGMRPTIGGAGHVVPPPKTSTSTMGIIMPIYTIGIVIFFTYTLMKIMFKKQDSNNLIYPRVDPDPVFRKRVFNEDYNASSEKIRLANRMTKDDVSNKLVVTALSDMLAEVDQRREALARQRDEAMQQKSTIEAKVTEEIPKVLESSIIPSDTTHVNGNVMHVNGSVNKSVRTFDKPEEKTTIKVLGMEVTESCEGGKKWSRPSTPVIPIPPLQLSPPASPPPPTTILLEKTVPAESQLLVSHADLKEEVLINDDEDDDTSSGEPAIMLSGKVTLSVIASDFISEKETAPLKVDIEVDKKEYNMNTTEPNNSQSIEGQEEIDLILDDDIEDSKYTTVSAATEAVAGDSEEEEDGEKVCEDILLDKNDYEVKATNNITENQKIENVEVKTEIKPSEIEMIDNQNDKTNTNEEEVDEEYEIEYEEEEVEADDENIDNKIVESESKNELKSNVLSPETKSENIIEVKEKVGDSGNGEEEEYEIEYEEEEEEEEEEIVPKQEKNVETDGNKISSNDNVNIKGIESMKENLGTDDEEIEEYEIEVEEDDEVEDDNQQKNKNEISKGRSEANKEN